MTKVTQTPPSR